MKLYLVLTWGFLRPVEYNEKVSGALGVRWSDLLDGGILWFELLIFTFGRGSILALKLRHGFGYGGNGIVESQNYRIIIGGIGSL